MNDLNLVYDRLLNMENFELSYSMLSTFNSCRLRFVYSYIYPLDASLGIYSDRFSFGIAYHKSMEMLMKNYVETGYYPNVDILNVLLKDVSDIDKLSVDEITKLTYSVYHSFEYLKDYFIKSVDNIEQKVSIPGIFKGTIDLLATDLLNDETLIIDYKSSSYYLDNDSLELQLKCYAYGLYFNDIEFKDKIDEGHKVFGVILSPLYDSAIEYLKIQITIEDIREVESLISDVHTWLERLISQVRHSTSIKTDADLMKFLVYKKYLMSGNDCAQCSYSSLCPYGSSIDIVKSLVDEFDDTSIMDLSVESLVETYKYLKDNISIFKNYASIIETKIRDYLIQNNTNKVKLGKYSVTLVRKKLVSSYVNFKELYDKYGDAVLKYVNVNLADLVKFRKYKQIESDMVKYNVKRSLYSYIVVK